MPAKRATAPAPSPAAVTPLDQLLAQQAEIRARLAAVDPAEIRARIGEVMMTEGVTAAADALAPLLAALPEGDPVKQLGVAFLQVVATVPKLVAASAQAAARAAG